MQNTTTYNIANQTRDVEFLTRLNIILSTNYNYQENINTALAMLGQYTHHDRIYIFEIQHDATTSILYEWFNKGLNSIQYQLQHQKIILDKNLEKQLYAEEHITIDESDETINQEIKTILTRQSGKKLILLPLIESGTQFAFIAFIQCQQKHDWNKDEIQLMKIIASMIAINQHKKFLLEKLQQQRLYLKKSEQQIKILETHLNTLNQKTQPAWLQLRETFQEVKTDKSPSQLDTFDRDLCTLNKLYRNISVK